MRISTRGRYAMKLMVELGQQFQKNGNQVMDLKKIARNQKLSLKYIEHIISRLKRAGLVDSVRGVSGGYKLNRPLEKISSLEILESAENISDFCPCFKQTAECPFENVCGLCDFWKGLRSMLVKHLQGISLADIVHGRKLGPRK
jgi:Rrf2 family protein